MTWLMAAMIGLAAMTADFAVETASELFATFVMDSDAGAIVEVTSSPASDVVDTTPQAAVVWVRR